MLNSPTHKISVIAQQQTTQRIAYIGTIKVAVWANLDTRIDGASNPVVITVVLVEILIRDSIGTQVHKGELVLLRAW